MEHDGDDALQAALNCGPVPVPDVMQTEKYRSHPLVVQAINNEVPLPLPVAVYLDAVAFTSALAGRSDSLLGVWVVNLVTWKRHLFSVQRSLDMCRCGCKGWCTMFPIFCALAFMLESMQAGLAPTQMHDGSPLPAELVSLMVGLEFTAVMLWVKGDWAELSKSLGLQGWASWIAPCFLCLSTQDELHRLYRSCNIDSLAWNTKTGYDLACRACEIYITITTPEQKALILGALEFMQGKIWKGRLVCRRILAFPQLQEWDRLDPSTSLMDVGAFKDLVLPVVVTFWRETRQGESIVDPMLHR